MKDNYLKISAFLLFYFATLLPLVAQDKSPVLLHFRFDRSLVEKDYMDNARSLSSLCQLFSDSLSVSRIDSVIILAYSSPEGSSSYNARLSHLRASAVKNYLVWKYPHLDQRRIRTCPRGENWNDFRRLIVEDPLIPHREEVLQILDHVPDASRCKMLLQKLNRGIAYRYIEDNILKYLRNAAVCLIRLKPDTCRISSIPFPLSGERLSVRKISRNLLSVPSPVHEATVSCLRRQEAEVARRPLLAIKTNLLFDLCLVPNVEVELPLGRRWSLNGEWMFPWWLFDGDKYCMQLLSGTLEGRLWLGNRSKRRMLTGHFLGIYAGGGKYDLQWDTNGYQGEFYIASGISYGYSTPIARHLNLEFSVGIGMLRTTYEHYHARDNYQTLLWQNNGKYTWFGPTKAKISLVWLLNRKVKKGGSQ